MTCPRCKARAPEFEGVPGVSEVPCDLCRCVVELFIGRKPGVAGQRVLLSPGEDVLSKQIAHLGNRILVELRR